MSKSKSSVGEIKGKRVAENSTVTSSHISFPLKRKRGKNMDIKNVRGWEQRKRERKTPEG